MNARFDSEELLPGATIGDHFVVRRRLGQGGMGNVYLAENTNLQNLQCAVKVLRPELAGNQQFVESLKNEASQQSRLKHDNVVQIYDFFESRGRYFLFQSYIRGKTLADHIADSPQGLPLRTALRWICEVLTGLDYAHKCRVLHCDIKPANVIIDENGHAKITDFGIARDLEANTRIDGMVAAGTPAYMSPEQITFPGGIDHRVDVYSTGAMLFEMLSGHLPFEQAPDSGSPFPQLLADPPDVRRRRADIPETLARIVVTAMQPDRERRFASCADFREQIYRYFRRVEWRQVWLPTIAGSVLVAGIATFGVWRWAVLKDEKATLDEATRSMQGAAKSLRLLCRESADRGIKVAGLDTAARYGDPVLLARLKSRIHDMDRNIDSYTVAYLNELHQLPAKAQSVIDAAERSSQEASASDEFAPSIKAVRTDYDDSQSGHGPALTADILQHCPQLTSGAPDQH